MVKALKTKKKEWYTIHAPKVFNEIEIGETLADDPNKIIGRSIYTNISNLIGDFTKDYMKLRLKINEIKDHDAYTIIDSFMLATPYLLRLIRRRTSKLDIVEKVETKDNKKLVVKTWLITFRKTQAPKRTKLRKFFVTEIKKIAKENTYDALILNIITGKIQKDLMNKMKVIYPLRHLEIRNTKLLK
ncbi:MAG: 30S ribosomal protein S3ae [Candidatus Parvarchaeota archaeon]|nr:30S ribosomal protein S3ae [Candidatus Jingweiarchaeum tengchongense]MCW1297688.1 30S ribosomal protein S3ae [Candidatus Jingweiarchaeum tengchongense]MCW1304333.1 30S ribosomal protein S3ae [Candidatus Jingweiarchaeum tengchongense]MCW1311174.1 30S ribosomal protein S3ae [Candidatus Jingweiarchaeum tengchongense]